MGLGGEGQKISTAIQFILIVKIPCRNTKSQVNPLWQKSLTLSLDFGLGPSLAINYIFYL